MIIPLGFYGHTSLVKSGDQQTLYISIIPFHVPSYLQ
jgi:hypothetical protein